jgi:hypothetical protein
MCEQLCELCERGASLMWVGAVEGRAARGALRGARCEGRSRCWGIMGWPRAGTRGRGCLG